MNVFEKKGAVIALALVATWLPWTAASAQTGSAGQAAAFLKVPVGARLMASPDIVAGMQPDASAMYSNAAFIASIDEAAVFVSSSRWLDDLSFSAIGAAVPLGAKNTVLGVGATLMYSGGLNGYDDSLNLIGEESLYDLGLDVTLSHRFEATGLSVAAGATYIREHVLPSDGSGYAFHLGASWWHGRNLFHAAARDLAGTVNFEDASWHIDNELVAGAGRVFESSAGRFFTGIQAARSVTYGTRLRLGVDYVIGGMFTLRTGINEDLDAAQTDSRFNAGFGMRYGAFAVEYAYTPQEYFAGAHTFSLGYSFGAHEAITRPLGVVPVGDLSPSVPPQSDVPAARADETVKTATAFLLVGGTHGTRDGALAEAHALELLNIGSSVEREGPRFRVVIGRFASFSEASETRARHRAKGHVFQIVAR